MEPRHGSGQGCPRRLQGRSCEPQRGRELPEGQGCQELPLHVHGLLGELRLPGDLQGFSLSQESLLLYVGCLVQGSLVRLPQRIEKGSPERGEEILEHVGEQLFGEPPNEPGRDLSYVSPFEGYEDPFDESAGQPLEEVAGEVADLLEQVCRALFELVEARLHAEGKRTVLLQLLSSCVFCLLSQELLLSLDFGCLLPEDREISLSRFGDNAEGFVETLLGSLQLFGRSLLLVEPLLHDPELVASKSEDLLQTNEVLVRGFELSLPLLFEHCQSSVLDLQLSLGVRKIESAGLHARGRLSLLQPLLRIDFCFELSQSILGLAQLTRCASSDALQYDFRDGLFESDPLIGEAIELVGRDPLQSSKPNRLSDDREESRGNVRVET